MLKVKLPDDSNSMLDLEAALKYKNGSFKYELNKEEKLLLKDIYKKYDSKIGEPDDDFKSVLLQPKTNQALYEAYNEIQIQGRLKKLRNKILLSSEFCPYCGILPPDEIDHYLPRSIFKATSVYIRNLVPICHTCNNKKRIAFDDGSDKTFFHAYYVKFPDVPFFNAHVNFKKDILTVNFSIDKSNISKSLKNKLNFQITRTNLEERLRRQINIILFNDQESLDTIYESNGVDGVKKLLTRKHKQYQKVYGDNFWQTAFILSLSKCTEFCDGGFNAYYQYLRQQRLTK
ncbi:HNH endonuclease [Lacinutrix salivirga]